MATAHVEVYRAGELVRTATVPAASTYRVTLPVGRYEVSNAGPEVGIHPVRIFAGRTTHQDLPDYCD